MESTKRQNCGTCGRPTGRPRGLAAASEKAGTRDVMLGVPADRRRAASKILGSCVECGVPLDASSGPSPVLHR